MEKILISACLIGDNCKYDGGNNKADWIERLSKYYDLVPFCPEVEGGLATPRVPSEIKNGIVFNKDGKDVTSYFNKGAEKALNICKHAGIRFAILKENSPSCGVYSIYNGNFNGRLTKGSGVTTSLLKAFDIKVISENEVESLLDNLDFQKQKQIEGKERNIEQDKLKKEEEAKEQFEKHSFKKHFDKKPFKKDGDFKKRSYGFKKERNEENKDFKFKKKKDFSKSFKKDGEKTYKKKSFGDKKFSGFKKGDGFKKSFHGKKTGFKKPSFKKSFKREK